MPLPKAGGVSDACRQHVRKTKQVCAKRTSVLAPQINNGRALFSIIKLCGAHLALVALHEAHCGISGMRLLQDIYNS
jgi:hypothetical protein